MRLLRIAFLLLALSCVSNGEAQTVYTTKTGEKYHTATCRYLKYSKREISLEQALALGYTACSVCKPPTRPAPSKTAATVQKATSNNSNTPTKKATATQCTGITKSGARCKRMTTNANGRSYQHQS